MNVKRRSMTVALLLALSAPVLHAQSAATQSLPNPAQPPDGSAKTRLTDNSFVQQAMLAGLTEIELSKLALKQSENPTIRQFAETMLKDHESSNMKLKQVAMGKKVSVPQALTAVEQQKINELRGKSGKEFTQAYVNMMKQGHDTSVGLFDQAAGEQAISQEFRDFAQQALPVLRMHQQRAHALTETDDSRMPTSSKTLQGTLKP